SPPSPASRLGEFSRAVEPGSPRVAGSTRRPSPQPAISTTAIKPISHLSESLQPERETAARQPTDGIRIIGKTLHPAVRGPDSELADGAPVPPDLVCSRASFRCGRGP